MPQFTPCVFGILNARAYDSGATTDTHGDTYASSANTHSHSNAATTHAFSYVYTDADSTAP